MMIIIGGISPFCIISSATWSRWPLSTHALYVSVNPCSRYTTGYFFVVLLSNSAGRYMFTFTVAPSIVLLMLSVTTLACAVIAVQTMAAIVMNVFIVVFVYLLLVMVFVVFCYGWGHVLFEVVEVIVAVVVE